MPTPLKGGTNQQERGVVKDYASSVFEGHPCLFWVSEDILEFLLIDAARIVPIV